MLSFNLPVEPMKLRLSCQTKAHLCFQQQWRIISKLSILLNQTPKW